MTTRTVLFVGYDGVGLLDLTGPFTVFWSASWFLSQRGEAPYERRVATVSGGPVTAADGMTLVAEPLSNFDDAPIDTLIVPGALDLTGATQRSHRSSTGSRKRAPRAPHLFRLYRNVRAGGSGPARRQASGHALAGCGCAALAVPQR